MHIKRATIVDSEMELVHARNNFHKLEEREVTRKMCAILTVMAGGSEVFSFFPIVFMNTIVTLAHSVE